MLVGWSEEDAAYVGYCPDLFPFGSVCHGRSAVEAYAALREAVADTAAAAEADRLPLPEARTRPMCEVEMAG